MILLNFQIFTLVRKKHSTIFVHSDLKCPFIKNFINTLPPQYISSWVLYYCSILLWPLLSTSNISLFAGRSSIRLQVAQVFVFDAFVPTAILTLWAKPSLPSWMAITLSIGYVFLLVSSRNKTMSSTLKFLTILFNLWQTCKVL